MTREAITKPEFGDLDVVEFFSVLPRTYEVDGEKISVWMEHVKLTYEYQKRVRKNFANGIGFMLAPGWKLIKVEGKQ